VELGRVTRQLRARDGPEGHGDGQTRKVDGGGLLHKARRRKGSNRAQPNRGRENE
jgi:hypothetical protein